jgi:hypothetical protein
MVSILPENAPRRLRQLSQRRISVRTQILLVFLFCLAVLGIGMVFVNTWLIAGLKENMRRQAIELAEDLGHKTSDQIQTLLGNMARWTCRPCRAIRA